MSTSTDDQDQGAQVETSSGAASTADAPEKRGMKDVWIYALARVALFVVITLLLMGFAWVIGAQVVLPVLGVLALLIAMPAAVFVFPGLRARANEGVTDWSVDRAAHKEYMREELTGRE
ncbi:DUF4229 domain-containing protein [Corynebacterium sputi]|uniref:DUF4229 domain-containing protein n=1 Tax=Corynebacterium sputi TaxID=489915 RepID=UPI00042446C9|nr:DUF4229 domain-containing protein [Corynebacterium sputi]